MSCNGCRVLRKGCSDGCILRPCLQWIEGAEAQGHATVFVAKFFGRAGLMNFISAVPENQRPALFQSLLFEACGRTVNPVFGAVGLLWSGNWSVCQAAVETVLKGGSLQPLISALRPCQAVPSMNMFSSLQQHQPQGPPPYGSRSPDSVLAEAMKSQQQQQQVPDVKPLQRSERVQQTGSVKREMPSPGLIAPVPRRIRPKLQVESITDEVGAIDLDLSLGFHSKQQHEQQLHQHGESKRVCSPCQSITSEGSVTSVDTAELKISLKSS